MRSDAVIGFEAVTSAHYPLLRRWLNLPHRREWWGDPETELGYIVDMVEGRDDTRPFIFSVDGEAAGYIQYWHVAPHQTETWSKDDPWLMELPASAIGIDLSIGEAERLSQGLGTRALCAFVGRLRGKGFRDIIIDPAPENGRAVSAYGKAGFVPVLHLAGRTPGVLIMQYVPHSKDPVQ